MPFSPPVDHVNALHGKSPGKSLAPYRECRGWRSLAERNGTRFGRGTFDRDDLKEAAGAAVRAMEPLAWSFDF